MHAIKELLNINDELRTKLNQDNLEYYNEILVYIRAGATFKKEIEMEEVLIELLSDLIDAQNQGLSAVDYFGKNPKKMSDELIKNIDQISFKDCVKSFGTCIGIYLLMYIFSILVNPEKGFDLKYIIAGLFLQLVIKYLAPKPILKNLYRDKYLDNRKKVFIRIFANYFFILLIAVVGMILSSLYLPEFYIIKLEGSFGIIVILSLTVFAIKKLSQKKLNRGFIPVTLFFCIVGVLSRTGNFNELFNAKNEYSLMLGLIYIGILLYFLNFYFMFQSKK